MAFTDRIAHAWNSFFSEQSVERRATPYSVGPVTSSERPDRPRLRTNSERTIISSIYTRIAIDVAAIRIEHCEVDEDGQFVKTIKSFLNECLNVQANTDQGARHFRQDIPLTLFSEGYLALLPVDLTADPRLTSSWDVKSMRVGIITDWRPIKDQPLMVKVEAYDEILGKRQELIVSKKVAAIVENPFYAVMNEPNSTLKRLIHKLSLLDTVDEIASQGKLDLIIQLPYVVKSETRKAEAERRTTEIKSQLKDSTYGIAYTDGTEKITQLNRSIENNLLEQVKYLKEELYSELGLTPAVMNGTASDIEMLNYMNRTIEPIMDATVEAMIRTFLTKTARTQGQTLMYFQSPFKMMPISELAKLADVLSRNQIATPNELRQPLGLKPSKAPQANALVNSNMPTDQQITEGDSEPDPADEAEANLDADMADLGLT